MDSIYGRVSRGDFRSYSLNQYVQLEITEIRKGSIELVITEFFRISAIPSPLSFCTSF